MSLFSAVSYRSKRALVVGGAPRMGSAVAELVRDAGAEVVAMDRAKVMSPQVISGSASPSPESVESGTQPAVAEVSGVLIRALADVVMQAGIAPDSLFQREERRLATSEPTDVRMPLPAYRALLARAMALTGDPAIGLRCALHASEAAFDLLAPLVAHVLTLRHAIQEAAQFQALVFDGAQLILTERAGVARVRYEFPRSHESGDRSLAEFLTAGLMRMLRGFRCSQSEFYGASFEHKRPGYHHAYTEAFEGKERFSQEFTGVEFAAHLLDRRHLHANPALQTLVHAEAEQRLERLSRPASVIDRLRMYLLNEPATRVPAMSVAARRLGVSVRTLRRRLAEGGHSYRGLTQDMQGERACMMLRNPVFTVQSIGATLGFADTAAFCRAFKRWTGRTARDYRNARP
jgi:AraC-like DNA-binding protein/NAD(P)-dependent dehydrogenase (short-subunit alcohol dehydrogenase family)